jgi:hypothetical protein
MRKMAVILAGLISLAALSVEASPLPAARAMATGARVTPPVELAAQGCGYAYRRTRWQDLWGYWHWGRCVPKWWGKGAFLPQG